LCDDSNHILSFDIIFFGKSINRILKGIKMFNSEIKLKDKKLSKKFIACIPVKDLKGRTIAYLVMPSPGYLETELGRIQELKVILMSFLIIYLILAYAILKFFQRDIEEKLLEIFDAVNSIKEFKPDLKKIKKLSEKDDEIGSLVTGDIPVARSVVAGAIHSVIEEKVEWDVGAVTPAAGGRLMADADFSVSFEIDVLALKSSYLL